jgi:hypothetical protein
MTIHIPKDSVKALFTAKVQRKRSNLGLGIAFDFSCRKGLLKRVFNTPYLLQSKNRSNVLKTYLKTDDLSRQISPLRRFYRKVMTM